LASMQADTVSRTATRATPRGVGEYRGRRKKKLVLMVPPNI
jgi:hypothetical protein